MKPNGSDDSKTYYEVLIAAESTVGGGLSECPFCGVPRSKRSDYVRCSRCGINWLEGEDLGKHPKIDRFLKVVEQSAKQGK